jgi:FtsP/CotA-like multicopper oxidase with cupredoxin domain
MDDRQQHDADHVVHIHPHPFRVVRIDGEPLAKPVWRDTVVVPRESSVTYRSRFLDCAGRLVLLCRMMTVRNGG